MAQLTRCDVCQTVYEGSPRGDVSTVGGVLDVCGKSECVLSALKRPDVVTLGEAERIAALPKGAEN